MTNVTCDPRQEGSMRIEFQTARDSAWRLAREFVEDWNDPMTVEFGCEVNGLIRTGQRRAVRRFEQETGWKVDDLLNECKRRTSVRWVHFSPLPMLVY